LPPHIPPPDEKPSLYIFLDEGGNFDFSAKGTRFFTVSAVSLYRPFTLHQLLDSYKYDLIEYRLTPRIDTEYFHCADDNRYVREKIFTLLGEHLPKNCVDAVIVEKRKTHPSLQVAEKFYPRVLGYLLQYALKIPLHRAGEVVVITDTLPHLKKRATIEKGIKTELARILPKDTPYRLMHHASRAHYGLQIADYCNWAIFRKWESGDAKAHRQIAAQIRSEFDIFQSGSTYFY
jgi:hypothetical protein